MFKAGLEHRLFDIDRVMLIDGIFESTNLCDIAKAVSVHYPKFEYDCIIQRLYSDAEKCLGPRSFGMYIEASECFPKYWYRKPLAPPILSGPNYQRCGPDFNNSRCSTNKEDWEVQEPANGPCCNSTGYCMSTTWDCTCENCVDFGELTRCRFIFQFRTLFNENSTEDKTALEKHKSGEECCSTVEVRTNSLCVPLSASHSGRIYCTPYGGIYKKKVKNSKTFYFSNETTEQMPNSALVFGDFMERGDVWHVQVLIENSFQPINAFEEDRGPDECPQVLSGLGGTVHCYHDIYNEYSFTAL